MQPLNFDDRNHQSSALRTIRSTRREWLEDFWAEFAPFQVA